MCFSVYSCRDEDYQFIMSDSGDVFVPRLMCRDQQVALQVEF